MTETYQSRAQGYKTMADNFAPELNNLSYTRLAIFLLTGILIMLFAASGWVIPVIGTAIVGTVLFVMTLKRYNGMAEEKKQAELLKNINEAEVQRISNNFAAFPTGAAFLDRDHHYAADLDIFGSHSLFQLLNRTTTESGARLLASWLNGPADRHTVIGRQEAVRELTGQLDWRQNFQSSGMRFESANSNYEILIKWLEEPPQLLASRQRLRTISLVLGTLSTFALLYFVYNLTMHLQELSGLHLLPLIVMSVINSFYLKRFKNIAEDIILSTQRNIGILGAYESLMKVIEKATFTSRKLTELSTTFIREDRSATSEIGALKRILEMFQQKGTRNSVGKNAFYHMINNLLLIDVHLILGTEAWKARNKDDISPWIASVSEFEALASMAGFAHANPHYTFADISTETYQIDFKSVGHPLLKSKKRINNNFTMTGRGEITMITGSNMAGKSTFLRTVGINLVLAFMGAPCCASSASVSPLRVFTSMRTQDNLEESVSSFYAELKRIEQLLALVSEGEPIFFLLDEMFKGTNSQDRFRGGVSLIKQLSELNAFGMISTHDLDLANLTKDLAIRNFSFNSSITEGQILFDYRLTPGICTDFNASELMKRSGIRILSDILPSN
ncbi:DNA mismatch repair protein MutS [Dyadobacter sp. CY261]|uniref:MutS-related protein n=1 Tax=Dyadobacter sp. CY261 TaxID=2907203 RepID=UPI001F228A10|nr:DNA mismatch repair protein MutS [Dyadobacter sp. CY261]MCF0069837.1 DNA mismatch repair protein MutS [Dyadobacter sp. CY261]